MKDKGKWWRKKIALGFASVYGGFAVSAAV